MTKAPDPSHTNALLEALAARGAARELLGPTRDRWQLHAIETGRVCVRRGQKARAVHFVLDGELSVRTQKLEVERLESGVLVGLSPCITKEGTYPHELVAVGRTIVAELPAATLLELRGAGDGAYGALLGLELRTLGERLARTESRLSVVRMGAFPPPKRAPESMFGRLWRTLRARAETCPPIEPLLRTLPGLRSAPDAIVQQIGAGFRPRVVPAREVIALEDETEHSMYLVAGGQVDVMRKAKNGAMLMLAALREGALFGMSSLLSGSPRSASCVSAEEVKLYQMTREAYAALGPEAGQTWRECLSVVLHQQLRDVYATLVSALRVYETSGADRHMNESYPSLVMNVGPRGVLGRKTDDDETDDERE